MFGAQKSFQFRVTVNDLDAATAKIKQFFNEHGIILNGYNFSGAGFEGVYGIAGHDIVITIAKKPLWVFNQTMIDKVKEFLKGC